MFVDRAFSGCVGQDAGMSLQGSFDVLGFSEVLELLERKRQSGRLHVRAGGVTGHIYVRDGHLTGAESGDFTTPSTAGEARTRLEELCFEFLQCERGVFEFQPRVAAPWATQLSSSVETVLREARQRLLEWREIQTVITSMDARPRVVDELVTEAVTLTRDRWRLIAAIDGRRSVHRLARTLGLGTYEAGRLLKSLVDDGIVTIDAERPRASIASEVDLTVSDDDAGEEVDPTPAAAPIEGGEPAGSKPTRPLLRIGSRLGRQGPKD
jgi:hypothetical protein